MSIYNYVLYLMNINNDSWGQLKFSYRYVLIILTQAYYAIAL